MPQYPHLQNTHRDGTHLRGRWWELNELAHVQYLEQCLRRCQCSVLVVIFIRPLIITIILIAKWNKQIYLVKAEGWYYISGQFSSSYFLLLPGNSRSLPIPKYLKPEGMLNSKSFSPKWHFKPTVTFQIPPLKQSTPTCLFTKTASPANPMHVCLPVQWHVQIYNQIHLLSINPTGSLESRKRATVCITCSMVPMYTTLF